MSKFAISSEFEVLALFSSKIEAAKFNAHFVAVDIRFFSILSLDTHLLKEANDSV